MIKSGANVNAKNHFGDTPIHSAISKLRTSNISLLCKFGANPNATNKLNASPLEAAVKFRDVNCARVLLENGADPDQETSEVVGIEGGTTVIVRSLVDLANSSGDVPLGQLLTDYHNQITLKKKPETVDTVWAEMSNIDRLVYVTSQKGDFLIHFVENLHW